MIMGSELRNGKMKPKENPKEEKIGQLASIALHVPRRRQPDRRQPPWGISKHDVSTRPHLQLSLSARNTAESCAALVSDQIDAILRRAHSAWSSPCRILDTVTQVLPWSSGLFIRASAPHVSHQKVTNARSHLC